MANFYRDNADILFHMKHMDLARVIDLREDGFAEKDLFPYAPQDTADARDNYDRVLAIVGEIAGEFAAPRAREVDEEGAHFADGEVTYPRGIRETMERMNQADMAGFTMPRTYGGINMPMTIFSAAIEMVSRADASLMLVFGLQGLSDTIAKFGSEDQKQRYLPRFATGEVVGSMALTEPDSGSDLQSAMLRAHQDEDGIWRLNGVKRFITNGCGKVSLVMARSEDGSSSGRGLSLFIYERDQDMKIRRIEHKLGIKGSPTCELQFNNARAELLGQRKLGLIKYTIYLMNGARLAVAAQSLGIAEAAYREAYAYANDRVQFKKPVRDFTAVYEMLTDMKVAIEAARSLVYETSRIVDIKEGIEDRIEKHPERSADLRDDLKRYTRFASLFTPLAKSYAAEMANKVCYDAIQVHGGVGYTSEFDVERHYRDARITNIYEGTTQLQVVAAMGGVVGGVVSERLNEYEEDYDFAPLGDLFLSAQQLRMLLERAISHVKERGDVTFQEFHAARLVAMTSDVIIGYLLCITGLHSERKKVVARLYIAKALSRAKGTLDYILNDDCSFIDYHTTVIDAEEQL
ncbi:MAG: acyl-CoA dehydrogenase family protein [Deltaproteobacteria bacterium]|nr:acyl-CoA dehydrogenase family protein [Candidatus Anaeroferrophillus wilburensis]MBN2889111.1 acyl-CoA dehydrogenase family protein [Deltaproteobacteria bacterium]